ncbi:MAG: PIN domain-containing protein [archaeon]|nr:PIN domain-containing protein [archaeon]
MLFETRYFLVRFETKDTEQLDKLRSLSYRSKSKFVSVITIYEVYKISLEEQGKDVAKIRTEAIEREFEVVGIDTETARDGASLSSKLRIPMADSLIMATAKKLKIPCVTDDPHFSEVKRIWI